VLIDDLLNKYKEALPSTFVIPLEAESFVQQAQQFYPDEFAEWVYAHAIDLVATNLRRHMHADRQRARTGKRGRFRDATDQYDPDDPSSVEVFAQRFVVNHQNMWKLLGEMTAEDHRYVADQYAATGKRAQMEAAFHRAVAKHIGNRRTDEVYTTEQFVQLRQQLVT
jgi:hypothetical protein